MKKTSINIALAPDMRDLHKALADVRVKDLWAAWTAIIDQCHLTPEVYAEGCRYCYVNGGLDMSDPAVISVFSRIDPAYRMTQYVRDYLAPKGSTIAVFELTHRSGARYYLLDADTAVNYMVGLYGVTMRVGCINKSDIIAAPSGLEAVVDPRKIAWVEVAKPEAVEAY